MAYCTLPDAAAFLEKDGILGRAFSTQAPRHWMGSLVEKRFQLRQALLWRVTRRLMLGLPVSAQRVPERRGAR